jgi:hypothetical protein
MFTTVYGISMDTILICSIIDEEIMARAGVEPYYHLDVLKSYYK